MSVEAQLKSMIWKTGFNTQTALKTRFAQFLAYQIEVTPV